MRYGHETINKGDTVRIQAGQYNGCAAEVIGAYPHHVTVRRLSAKYNESYYPHELTVITRAEKNPVIDYDNILSDMEEYYEV